MFQEASADSTEQYMSTLMTTFSLELENVPHPFHFFVSPPFATSLCQGRSPQYHQIIILATITAIVITTTPPFAILLMSALSNTASSTTIAALSLPAPPPP